MIYKHKWDISVKLANVKFCFDNEAVAYTRNTKMIDQSSSIQINSLFTLYTLFTLLENTSDVVRVFEVAIIY